MGEKTHDLLARLAGRAEDDSAAAWQSVAATEPEAANPADTPEDPRLEELLRAIRSLAGPADTATPRAAEAVCIPPRAGEAGGKSRPAAAPAAKAPTADAFVPKEPESLAAAGLTEGEIEALALKYLLSIGNATGRAVAEQVKLPFRLVHGLLQDLKSRQLVVYRGASAANDYEYQLTDLGRERARRFSDHCTYFGSAPVSLRDYIASVAAQSLTQQHPTLDDLRRAFEDLLLSPRMLSRLGPAINSGRGLFLYGAPGNGKSSIAERITRAFGEALWIPRALGVDGDVIRLYDPANHEELPLEGPEGLLDDRRIDRRWIRIRRPTIIVGGELTMEQLEVTLNSATGICEAPLQLKSNCGTLVIDDFGRQRMSTDELLNRWIVPLEKRFDFLNLPSGKKIQVPFDQLIVFSTNLEPRDLVDDAFLRRIPYKISVADPTEEEFRELFRVMCPKLGFEYCERAVDYLIQTHYRKVERPFRCCHPRDLLLQIRNFCHFHNQPLELSEEYFDFAVENYFAVM
jgi:hypothetical protein